MKSRAELSVREYGDGDGAAVVSLWEVCGLTRPWNDPHRDIERKLIVDDGLFWVGTVENEIVATIMGGYEGHRGWVNYLAVHPEWRGAGFGRQLMDEMETTLKRRGCPKINLQVRTSNEDVLKFYEAIGYSVDNVVSMGKRLIDDEQSN